MQKYWHAKIDFRKNAHYPCKTWVYYNFYCMNVSLSVCWKEKYLIVIYAKRLKMGENCVAKSLRKFQFLHLLTRKKSRQRKNVKNKSCRQFYVIGGDFFFILTKSQKCGSDSQKCLAKYWPKSFFDQNFCKLTEHYENFLCT